MIDKGGGVGFHPCVALRSRNLEIQGQLAQFWRCLASKWLELQLWEIQVGNLIERD